MSGERGMYLPMWIVIPMGILSGVGMGAIILAVAAWSTGEWPA